MNRPTYKRDDPTQARVLCFCDTPVYHICAIVYSYFLSIDPLLVFQTHDILFCWHDWEFRSKKCKCILYLHPYKFIFLEVYLLNMYLLRLYKCRKDKLYFGLVVFLRASASNYIVNLVFYLETFLPWRVWWRQVYFIQGDQLFLGQRFSSSCLD